MAVGVKEWVFMFELMLFCLVSHRQIRKNMQELPYGKKTASYKHKNEDSED